MTRFLIVMLFLFFAATAGAGTLQKDISGRQLTEDTGKSIKGDSVIISIATGTTVPEKEKAARLSELTRFGFKNLFTDFSYNSSLPYAAQVNPNAEWFMRDYIRKHESYMNRLKISGRPYFHIIENILTQYGLPEELKYLAVIESHLKTSATSHAGAAGPWQFMPATARTYGLIVNSGMDERRDYLKSTHAASRFLLKLYAEFRDWLLVIAAYNGGPGRVYSAINKTGSRDFWVLQNYLPEESRNHVKKFIATHYIMETVVDANGIKQPGGRIPSFMIGGRNITETELSDAETKTISGKFNARTIAANLSIDIVVFNRYNPHMDTKLQMGEEYDLLLPREKMETFKEKKYEILSQCVQQILGNEEIPGPRTIKEENKKNKRS